MLTVPGGFGKISQVLHFSLVALIQAMKQKNRFVTLGDLQKALSDAAALGYADRLDTSEKRSKPTGPMLAEQLLLPGSWAKKQEKSLKAAYLAGFDHAGFAGRADGRPREKLKRPVQST